MQLALHSCSSAAVATGGACWGFGSVGACTLVSMLLHASIAWILLWATWTALGPPVDRRAFAGVWTS